MKLNGRSAGRASRLTKQALFQPPCFPPNTHTPGYAAGQGKVGQGRGHGATALRGQQHRGSPTAFPLRGALKFCCNAARQSREAPPNGPRTAVWGAGEEARPAVTGGLRAAKPPAPAPPASRPDPTPKTGTAPTVGQVPVSAGGGTHGAVPAKSCRGLASPGTPAAPRPGWGRQRRSPCGRGGPRPSSVSVPVPVPPRGSLASPRPGPVPAAARPARAAEGDARPAGHHLCGSRRPEG